MKPWYETNFCNRRDWILDNLEFLSLDNDELLLCLLIDFLKSNGIVPSYEILSKKLKLRQSEIDSLIRSLTVKGYIKININDFDNLFDLSPLFSQKLNTVSDLEFESIFTIYEEVFGRPLNPNELEKLSDFIRDYSKDKCIDALREAEARNKLSFAYIEVILRNA